MRQSRILARFLLLAAVVLLAERPVFSQALLPIGGTATVAANAECVIWNAVNSPSLAVTITGTWTGTITFSSANDAASTWLNIPDTKNQISGATSATTTANGGFWIPNPGFAQVRACGSGWSSGTATLSAGRGYGVSTATGSGGGGSNAAASATGSAVPSSASYSGVNIGGTLTGATGKAVGSERAAAVVILDASGNQITSFGGSGGTASNVGSTVPSQATAAGFSDGTNLQLPRLFDADTSGGTQYVLGASLRKSTSSGSVEAGTSADPLRTDPTGTTTQPISAVSLPLPSGASTAAKQPALGTAGTASADVVTVQGIASMTPLKVDGSAVTQPVSVASIPSHAVTNAGTFQVQCSSGCSGGTQYAEDALHSSGDTVTMAGAVRRDSATSGTSANNDNATFNVDANGRLYVQAMLVDSNGTELTPSADGAVGQTAKTTGPSVKCYGSSSAPTAVTAGQDQYVWCDLSGRAQANVAQINGVAPSMGNGTSGTGVQRVTLASDSTGQVSLAAGSATIGALSANQTVNVAQVGGTTTSTGNGASGSGVQRVTLANDSTGQVALAAGSALVGQVAQVATATTTNTTATCFITSAASTNATNCKASPGNVYTIRAVNTTASLYYLRMYNTSSSPTCSSSTGFIETIPIPASTTGAGVVIPQDLGQAYSTGISFCLTGGGANNDNTNAATGVYLTVLYK